MKKLTALLLCFSILIFSCNNPAKTIETPGARTDNPEPKQETGPLNDYLKDHEEPSQAFTVSSSKPTQIKGKRGTVISINPSDLETIDGKPIGKSIKIELKELTNQQQLLCANAQTVSNGQLLVSGGAYYINMTSDGQQLKLRDGKSLSVSFPKLTDKEMALFYGQRDSTGQMIWQKANEILTATPADQQAPVEVTKETKRIRSEAEAILDYIESGDTTTTPEEREKYAKRERDSRVEQKLYDAVNIQTLGWINVDMFLDADNRTDLLVKVNPSDSVVNANVYLVFKDINSVTQKYYYQGNAKDNSVKFERLPIGYKTTLIAYTVKDGKAYAFASNVTIGENQKIDMAFKPVTEQEFRKLLGK